MTLLRKTLILIFSTQKVDNVVSVCYIEVSRKSAITISCQKLAFAKMECCCFFYYYSHDKILFWGGNFDGDGRQILVSCLKKRIPVLNIGLNANNNINRIEKGAS